MDLKILKEKALKFKDKALEMKDKVIEGGAKKLAGSGFTINSKDELEKFIEKSAETTFKNKDGVEKKYSNRVIVIFGDEKTDFFKKALYQFPILLTKGFSQSIPLKLAKNNIKDIDIKIYNVEKIPSLVVFENKEFFKVISGEENIIKLVKTFNLDINKAINEM